MSSTVNVLFSAESPTHLPECAVPGVSLLLHLDQLGRQLRAEEHVRVNRQGGYAGVDALVFLLLFFANPTYRSLRSFAARVTPFSTQIAALSGRRRLLSTSSLSRLLNSVTAEEVHAFRPWLLFELPGAQQQLTRPDVLHRDQLDAPWLVLDFDPTLTGVRQRELPSENHLPNGKRRLAGIATPMRLGRKRGRMGIRTATLYCQGAGLWLYADVGTGIGVHNRQFADGVATAADCGRRLGPDDSPRILLRADGEFGTNRSYECCRQSGVALITRTSRYEILDSCEAIERMTTGTWRRVPDSGSGPERWAMDLGDVRFRVKDGLTHPSGEPVESQTVRVVVSRTLKADAEGCGRQIQDQKFELFVAVDVPEEAFSAEQVVFMFYARTGHENNFLLAKKQQLLGKTYCKSAPGQLFMTLVALAVWNMKAVFGGALDEHRESRPGVPVEPWLGDETPPLPEFLNAKPPKPKPEQEPKPKPTPNPAPKPTAENVTLFAANEKTIGEQLRRLPWPHLLSRRPGWIWNSQALHLDTDDSVRLIPKSVEKHRDSYRVRLRSEDLPIVQSIVTIDEGPAKELARLFALRQVLRPRKNTVKHRRIRTPPPEPTQLVCPADEPTEPPATPILLPSMISVAARNAYDHLIVQMRVRIRVTGTRCHARRPVSRFDRQHRRLSWFDRALFGALGSGAIVNANVSGPERAPWSAS